MPKTAKAISKKFLPMSRQERDYLFKLYVTLGYDAAKIADRLNVCERTIFNRLKAHGISKASRKKGIHHDSPHYCSTCG